MEGIVSKIGGERGGEGVFLVEISGGLGGWGVGGWGGGVGVGWGRRARGALRGGLSRGAPEVIGL